MGKKKEKSDQNAVAELTREGLYKENKWLWEENKKLKEENENLKAIIEHYKKFEEGKEKLEGMLMEEDTLQELKDLGKI